MSLKKIFKGAGKSFKKFAKTKLGKAVLIGAALWVGGALLSKGLTALKGAAASAAAPAAAPVAAAPGATAAATTAGEGALVDAMASNAASTVAADAGAAAMPEIATSIVPYTAEQQAVNGVLAKQIGLDVAAKNAAASVATGAPTVPGGILSRAGAAVKGGVDWMGANPIPTLVAGNMIQGFAQPDPYEEWLKQRSYEQANSNYAGVYGDGRATQIEMPTSGLLSQANKPFLPGV